jgi:uncharacterized protein (DUF1697 family)
MRYVALLRGVNVGGSSKLSMTDLRELLASLGHADVKTHLQSGNALFTSERNEPSELAQEMEDRLTRDLGLETKVLIRTPEELAAVVEGNPFPGAVATPTRLHVSFLSAQPDGKQVAAIDPRQFEPDQFRVGDRAVYLWLPDGAYATKLSNAFWERRLGVIATTRNWNTVTKLWSLANG